MASAYLTFTEASGGAFFIHWSETPVEGALAAFLPSKPVPKFKLKTNGGRSELCRGVAGGNKKPFYKGWAAFVREAYKNSSKFTFLSDAAENPVGLYLCKQDTTVYKVDPDVPVELTKDSGFSVVGVIPSLNPAFSIQKMLPSLFTSIGEEHGAAEKLD
ncbi:hypothetical protein HOP50_16g78290 [Chloropicon primus]|uniref:Immune mapped protein 2 N-terminal domain-containing protein n=1 Tax=Chloropicon primus TaxID=1764295 RepID=A0A5B8MY38_9CHLO|nr:hypothetical protein A3770_16p77990 [Chloropicon primus]UPR04487.1 hypothetical protein HOP50_16g78290 [Chloropicon primus]|eukprot:QDZ25281.1 hypothetical protein A3770_16p77990 [Chloropicon primus]